MERLLKQIVDFHCFPFRAVLIQVLEKKREFVSVVPFASYSIPFRADNGLAAASGSFMNESHNKKTAETFLDSPNALLQALRSPYSA